LLNTLITTDEINGINFGHKLLSSELDEDQFILSSVNLIAVAVVLNILGS